VTGHSFQLHFGVDHRPGHAGMREAFSMPKGTRKRRWFVVIALLGTAAIGIGVGVVVGYAAGRLHRGDGPLKPLPVRVERAAL